MSVNRNEVRAVIYLAGEHAGFEVLSIVGFSVWEGDGSRDILFAVPAMEAKLVRKEVGKMAETGMAVTLH